MVFVRSYFSKGHTYLAIVENVWEEGRARQRTVLYLGRADNVDPAVLRRTLAELRKLRAAESSPVFTRKANRKAPLEAPGENSAASVADMRECFHQTEG